MKTGKLKLFTDAMARELVTDDEGKVTAVSYVDKTTRTETYDPVPRGRWWRRAPANRRGCC